MGFEANTVSQVVPSVDSSQDLIFIQAGPASNWVGAHFWNLQESNVLQRSEDSPFCLSALFRGNEDGSALTIGPRLIAIDTLGSVRSPQMGMALTAPYSTALSWDGNIQTIKLDNDSPRFKIERTHEPDKKASETKKSEVPNCRFWADCLLPTARRRWKGEDTVVILREYLDSSSAGDVFASPSRPTDTVTSSTSDHDSPSHFSSFAQGLDLYRLGGDAFECFEDHFHKIVEECDRPSGFPLLVDSDSGFAGLGLRLGEFLCDEFAKSPVFTTAIASYCQPFKQSRRCSTVCLNRLALFTAMEEVTNWPSCSAWMPVMHTGNVCTASSDLAAGLTTVLTPVLLNSNHKYSSQLHDFINALIPTRKKMMSLSLVAQDLKSTPLEPPTWIHANTFSMTQKITPRASFPCSRVCHFSTRGFILKEDKVFTTLPHLNGFACSLLEGTSPRLSSFLPTAPLTVPQLNTVVASCDQPAQSRVHALIEAVSHWTDKNQWLPVGLDIHSKYAFHKFHTTYLETDELCQLKESAVDRLIAAYASVDG